MGTGVRMRARSANPILSLSFGYLPYANGNISNVTDLKRSETVNYTYDELDRLTSASGPFSETYAYTVDNNLWTKNTSTYTYNATHKHAVASLSSGESYGYDANGNMTLRVENGQTYTQAFDAENRLISITENGHTTQFVYDGNGNMVKKINPDGSRTIYVAGNYEVRKDSGGTVIGSTTYYPAAGAMRVVTGTNVAVYYTLGDQLGSTSVVTDASGAVMGTQGYFPFGETRYKTGSLITDRLFTGQQEITGLGLYNYKARFYDPSLGRFISPDTITPGGPEGLNRYGYVLNNPINASDPTGHMADECGDFGCNAGQSVYRLGLNESQLVRLFQQNQGNKNYCASYAISTGINLLYGANTKGSDVVNAFTKGWYIGVYSWGTGGSAVLPSQQVNIVNDFSSALLPQRKDLPSAKIEQLSSEDLKQSISNPNQAVLFTYNTEPGNIFSGHVIVLAAYDPDKGFGFLNSGAQRDPVALTWISIPQIQGYINDPIGSAFIVPDYSNFVVITRP
jgi:RHS repeat-associated protein